MPAAKSRYANNVAYGTISGTVERKNAPALAGVKFRDPEAGAILAADFKERAREAGLEAEASAVSKSVIRAQGGR
jgi:urease gamma subunit